jgi:fimbrial chaperone protein
MQRRALLLAGNLLGLALVAQAAFAKGHLQARPTMLELPPGAAAGRMTLANTGDEPVGAQVRIYAWVQKDGNDVLVPTADVVLSPPIVDVPAGGEQLVRIVRQGKPPGASDVAYRVVVDELPGKTKSRDAAVGILMRYVLPLFVRSEGASDAALTCAIVRTGAQAALECRNSGGRAAQLGATRLKGSGKSYELTAGLYGYVLPGSQRRWPLDSARLKLVGRSPKMESQLNGAPVTITVADSP